jgi:hypothetical protein
MVNTLKNKETGEESNKKLEKEKNKEKPFLFKVKTIPN